MINVEIKDEYTNDIEYNCPDCGSKGICFTKEGQTNFCPSCGGRNIE